MNRRFLWKSSKLGSFEDKLVEDTGFLGPVSVAVTTVRLVREAEI